MLPQPHYRRHRTAGLVSVVLFGSLCLGLIPASCSSPASPSSQVSPEPQACSAVGSASTLRILLEGEKLQAYTMEASTAEGDVYRVQCAATSLPALPSFSRVSGICDETGVTFYAFTPDEVTITLVWNHNRRSQWFKPVYETYWPDGPQCDSYRDGTIHFTIPRTDS